MTCEETRPLLHGYADGELDLAKSLDVERHLAGCAACAAIVREIRVMRSALRSCAVTFDAPTALRAKIRDAIRGARATQGADRRASAIRRTASLRPPLYWATGIAAAAVFLVIVLAGGLRKSAPSADDIVGNEIVASHVRSLMANHLADVISTNQHTVKPWFDGKIDFAPTFEDFAARGFPLTGGRLDYADGRPVAALVYHRREHIINLFTWPIADASNTAPRLEQRQGYNVVHWQKGEMAYWAVSNLNGVELMSFAGLVRADGAPVTPRG
jgi:anti-sigma factor RsiW